MQSEQKCTAKPVDVSKLTAYELILEKEVDAAQAEGYYFRHKKSGARVAVLSNDDENKVFCIGFRTPPADSTGLPHILEHSVLCGSKKFPSKDPFVELVKGSLNTFLNAMTYPDKTVYPVASCNDQDFQNLMHVYLDAVFYTNIYEHEEIFRQEGWHYELEDEEAPLQINGVVYNEMKGAFSSPEGVLEREILNALYPDTPYGFESGGDPDDIPKLKYSEFLGFHSRYYHPSNSYIYLYGNMDVEEKLGFLDKEYLSRYDAMPIDSGIILQAPFEKMQTVERRYSITSEESEKENTYLSYNKSIGTTSDQKLCCAFQVLEYALLTAPGAPLKQALLDAGIGKDIMGSFDNGTRQPVFSVIAKNSEREKKDEFVQIIEQTLTDLAKNGIDRKALEAGLHYYEFSYREGDYGRFPKGLMCGLEMYTTWLYDEQDPFSAVRMLPVFEELKKELGSSYFEDLIQKWLLDNPHGACVLVEPEKGLTAKNERRLADELAAYKASLSDKEIKELIAQTKALRAYQEEPSTKEELEAIPLLRRKDLREEILPVCNEPFAGMPVTALKHPIPTNGIGYVNLLFDTKDVPERLFAALGILRATLGLIDTEHYAYGELVNEINRSTGGITANLEYLNLIHKDTEYRVFFRFSAKALYEKLPVAFEMLEEILTSSKLEDTKRLYEIVAEQKSRMQMFLQNSGHVAAAGRANAYISPLAYMTDCMDGIAYYEQLKQLEEQFEQKSGQLVADLQELMQLIFRKERLLVDYTGGEEGEAAVRAGVNRLCERLYQAPSKSANPFVFHVNKKNEGFRTASKVQYVARTGNFRSAELPYTGALRVLKVILGYDYLWNQVRVLGGAYGCMNSFAKSGYSYFVSYRDPNLEQTMETYEKAPAYLEAFDADEREMTKYIIGTLSELDAPLNPAAKGKRGLVMALSGITEEELQKERREILNCSPQDIRRLGAYVQAVLDEECFCVIGSEEIINAERERFGVVRTL